MSTSYVTGCIQIKNTVPFIKAKKNKDKITVLTAFDYTTASILDQAGIDMILVGDSLAGPMQGKETTISVTMEEMIYHTKCVAAGVQKALVIADMPFMSYQVSIKDAVKNAGRFLKEAGATAVKIEGGAEYAETVKALTKAGIPVMGHIGLLPQSVHIEGGYKVRKDDTATKLIEDAKLLEASGAFSIVLEGMLPELAKAVTESIQIPTIGIGAGAACDGQVLVTTDLLGLGAGPVPKFVKKYGAFRSAFSESIHQYIADVKLATFPSIEFQYQKKAA